MADADSRSRSRSPRPSQTLVGAPAYTDIDILEDQAVLDIVKELGKYGGEPLRAAFLYNISDPRPHGHLQVFQGYTVLQEYIGMLRGLGITDRTIGILLYHHSRLSEKPKRIFRYTQPALVAGLQLQNSHKNFGQVWRDDYFPWRATHNMTAQGAQTWSLIVLKQLIERCHRLSQKPWPPPQPLVAKGEGACVQCGSFCSSRCKHCLQCPGWPDWRTKPGFLCETCESYNRTYYWPDHAKKCMTWKHCFAVAGDDDS